MTSPRMALYWATSCGGCEVAVANLHELFLELAEQVELFFCPALVDRKKKDVEALPDAGLALTLFNGALRTDENVEMARLLRRKSRLLVAFGACAQAGGVPALSNRRPAGRPPADAVRRPARRVAPARAVAVCPRGCCTCRASTRP